MAATINADNGVSSGSAGLKSSADSSGVLQLQTNGTVAISIDASQNVNFAGTAQRITGDFSNAAASRVAFKTSTVNGNTIINALPNGTAVVSRFRAFNAEDPTNASFGDFGVSSSQILIQSSFGGTGTYLPMTFFTGGSERVRIDTSGNVGIGTDTPSTHLHVYGAGTTSTSYTNGDAAGATLTLQDSAGASGNGGQILFGALQGFYAGIKGFIENGTGPAGSLLFQTRTTSGNIVERMRIDSSGNLLMATTTTAIENASNFSVFKGTTRTTLTVNHTNSSAGDAYVRFGYNGSQVGSITIVAGGTTVAYNTSSDYRLKNIIGPITNSGAYIDSLNPVEGTWKADGSTFIGLIAHEVQEVSRTTVATGIKDGEAMQGMDYSSAEIIANLIAEVKSLRSRVTELETK